MFDKKTVFKGKKHSVTRNSSGHYQLSPLPTLDELDTFYKKDYYELIKKGGRAPELRRQMKKDKDSIREKKWLQANLYKDIMAVIQENFKRTTVRLLDIGCGTGEMIRYMSRQGVDVAGIEPYEKKKDFPRSRRGEIFSGTLAEAVRDCKKWKKSFDGVTIMSVLEHVQDPDKVISQAAEFL